jgi:hypothetical protein
MHHLFAALHMIFALLQQCKWNIEHGDPHAQSQPMHLHSGFQDCCSQFKPHFMFAKMAGHSHYSAPPITKMAIVGHNYHQKAQSRANLQHGSRGIGTLPLTTLRNCTQKRAI